MEPMMTVFHGGAIAYSQYTPAFPAFAGNR